VADATEQSELVGLEPLSRASSVAEPAAGELAADLFDRDRQAGGETFYDRNQRATMGLARCQ
jgi:hypothetical protein